MAALAPVLELPLPLRDARADQIVVGYTPDTFPLVGEVPGSKGLWASVGMNGHGSKYRLENR